MDAAQQKIVILNAVEEDEVLRTFQEMNILISSEIFYFTDVNDGILIKQGL